MDNIIKNPTFIAVIAGVITYTYITWRKSEKKKKQKKNKNKKNIKEDKNEIVMSGIVALIVWFLVYGYLNYGKNKKTQSVQQSLPVNQFNQFNQPGLPQMYQPVPTYRLVQDSPKSFTMMNQFGGGVAFPANNVPMPDVFVDNFN